MAGVTGMRFKSVLFFLHDEYMATLALPPLPSIVPPLPLPTIGTDRPAPPSLSVTSVPDVPLPERTHVSSLVTEAHEALMGIPADITSGRGTMYEIVTRGNRLRGIGFILVIIALIAAVFGLMR